MPAGACMCVCVSVRVCAHAGWGDLVLYREHWTSSHEARPPLAGHVVPLFSGPWFPRWAVSGLD